jgi:hypothetical protein
MIRATRQALVAGTLSTALLAVGSMGVVAQEMEAETAQVRVLHASPDAPAVDVYANGDAILTEVPFGVISDYLEVPAATDIQIQVVPAGADPADGAVIDATLAFEAGSMTTVAATNSVESIEAQVISDEPAPTADETQVRVVHLSADAPAVDVAVDGGDVVVSELAYPDATDYLTLPAGEYDLEIRAAGTTDVAFDIDPLTLDAGMSYSAFAIGSLADGTFTVLPAVDATAEMAGEGEADTALVRVLHGSPDAPAVDVYANGGAVLTDVPFGVISDYLEVPAGEYQIQVVAAGADPADGAVIDATLTFEAGTRTTVAATNFVESIEAQVISDEPAPTADEAQIRVVHLSADSPAVNIAPDGERPLIRRLAYPDATDYLTVPAGEYDLEVRPAGEDRTTVAFDIDPLTLEAGTSYSAFAIGSLADGTFTVLPAVDATPEMAE